MLYPVLKGASYTLVHAPNLMLHQGTSLSVERQNNPSSELLEKLPEKLRSFSEAVQYSPNQVYIGNLTPDELAQIPRPWHQNLWPQAQPRGKYGEIMPEDEFLGLLQAVDVFDLVLLERVFQEQVKAKLIQHPILKGLPALVRLNKNTRSAEEIARLVAKGSGEPLYMGTEIVGCVKKAHDFDPALTQHVMLENLVNKATGVLALQSLLVFQQINAEEIDYIIECSEEACGDMNQRGGGNFAKAIGEICGCVKATGSDTRSFCASPAHAVIEGAALVQSGIYHNVVIVAGGSSAKLGMNTKELFKKGLPPLEDMLGSFALLLAPNDGISPVIRTDAVGYHSIGAGGSPQAVVQAIVVDPLNKAGLKIRDIDRFAPELQNVEVTEAAGAGDVAQANYKMIAALGVKKGEFQKEKLEQIVRKISIPGYAPTQGHIPSGIPYMGQARDQILAGQIQRVMIIGKGSLFLGRLTNLFDGISFILEQNTGLQQNIVPQTKDKIKIGVTILGSELGPWEVLHGANMAQKANPDLEVTVIGSGVDTDLPLVEAFNGEEAHLAMERMLSTGTLQAAVTMHYSFPIGVATVGRVITPAQGKEMFIAATTGISDVQRVPAMVKNALYGIAVAKAYGIEHPKVGILNIEGAQSTGRILKKLAQNGYPIHFVESIRRDGGFILRGNDILLGLPDVLVVDSLTGNVLVKMFSAYTSGGNYEGLGFGNGPAVGENYQNLIGIISRASGKTVTAGAIQFMGRMVQGGLRAKVGTEFQLARQAGLDILLETAQAQNNSFTSKKQPNSLVSPGSKPVSSEILGVDILQLEDAVYLLWQNNLYAESGMGCTGPVVLVAEEDKERAQEILRREKFIE
ncbi:glycine/sarcosine/betaine reductase complex component C subunit beta [Bacillota bacterium LX-D]|nr:glycine/sarcosine/betaine reductase complex component C subunit beta [Bacillota bacterium LX-D]